MRCNVFPLCQQTSLSSGKQLVISIGHFSFQSGNPAWEEKQLELLGKHRNHVLFQSHECNRSTAQNMFLWKINKNQENNMEYFTPPAEHYRV